MIAASFFGVSGCHPMAHIGNVYVPIIISSIPLP